MVFNIQATNVSVNHKFRYYLAIVVVGIPKSSNRFHKSIIR